MNGMGVTLLPILAIIAGAIIVLAANGLYRLAEYLVGLFF